MNPKKLRVSEMTQNYNLSANDVKLGKKAESRKQKAENRYLLVINGRAWIY